MLGVLTHSLTPPHSGIGINGTYVRGGLVVGVARLTCLQGSGTT